MLDSSFNGGIIYDLNKINDIADQIDQSEVECLCGDESCEGCVRGDAMLAQMQGARDIDGNDMETPAGAAGSDDSEIEADAQLGCDQGDDVVGQVKRVMMDNAEKSGKSSFDPLGFFKNPVVHDMYEPKTSYGPNPLEM